MVNISVCGYGLMKQFVYVFIFFALLIEQVMRIIAARDFSRFYQTVMMRSCTSVMPLAYTRHDTRTLHPTGTRSVYRHDRVPRPIVKHGMTRKENVHVKMTLKKQAKIGMFHFCEADKVITIGTTIW